MWISHKIIYFVKPVKVKKFIYFRRFTITTSILIFYCPDMSILLFILSEIQEVTSYQDDYLNTYIFLNDIRMFLATTLPNLVDIRLGLWL